MAEPKHPAQTVVITGGAGGLGAAMGLRFTTAGANVALLDLDLHAAQAAAAALGPNALGLACDVTDFEDCQRAFDAVRARFGPIDVLINNAGITQRSLFIDADVAVLDRVMRVNWLGSAHCTKAALPDLIARKGLVAGISSVAGYAPLVGRTGYAASKHAMHGFFDSLRTELASKGVQVLVVCPAYVDTPLSGNALNAEGQPIGDGARATAGGYMTPTFVAERIYTAVQRRKRLIRISPVAHLAWWLTRLVPRLYAWLMVRSHRDEFPL
jgi:NAD(P)-dependent dehydrogenase (short-subunit alcohol dehydrogenase family)